MDSNRKAVLCLAQDELTLRVRRMLLEHFGYAVLCTDSVKQMRNLLRDACPDMLLLDTNDPSIDCEQVAGSAKAICPDLVSVVLTPEHGVLKCDGGSVDRYLKIDGPREEWLSEFESLFKQQSGYGTNFSNSAP